MEFSLLNDEPVTGPEADLPGAGQAARQLDAGFADLAAWRSRGLFDGPVVFLVGRLTSAREQRSRELGARITSGTSVLFEHIDAACAEIRQRRS